MAHNSLQESHDNDLKEGKLDQVESIADGAMLGRDLTPEEDKTILRKVDLQ